MSRESGPQIQGASLRKQKERERLRKLELTRVRSRATVTGRGRGRPRKTDAERAEQAAQAAIAKRADRLRSGVARRCDTLQLLSPCMELLRGRLPGVNE